MHPNENENIQLKSKSPKAKKTQSKKDDKKKGSTEDVWDDIIDTLAEDKDFIQDTIKESDHIDKLYGKNNKNEG